MTRARPDVKRVAGAHAVGGQLAVRTAELDVNTALHEVLILVLALVVLERERLAFVHVQHLAEVAIGRRPSKLVTPWLVDARLVDGLGMLRHAIATPQCPRSRSGEPRRPRASPPPSTHAPAVRCRWPEAIPSCRLRGRT